MSAKIIQQLNLRFLEGGFINADTETHLFEFLEEDSANVALVNQFLACVGVKIVQTSNQRTWYPVYLQINEITRKRIEETVVENKRVLRHLISFFRLTLGATGGAAPQGGVPFRVSTLSDVIHDNTNLIDSLKLICSRLKVSNDTIQSMVNSAIKWAERNDLIVCVDATHGEYRFTGKVDWVNDMVVSFDECIERKIEEDSPETGHLF